MLMHKQSFMGRNTIKPSHPREVNWEGEGEGNWIRSKVCCSIRIFTKPGQVEKDRIGYETFPSIPCGDSQLDGNIEPNAITTFPAISIVFCLLFACLVGRYFRTWCGCCLGLFSIDFLGGGKIDENWGNNKRGDWMMMVLCKYLDNNRTANISYFTRRVAVIGFSQDLLP